MTTDRALELAETLLHHARRNPRESPLRPQDVVTALTLISELRERLRAEC